MNKLNIEHNKQILSSYKYLKAAIKECEVQMLEIDTERGIKAIRYDKESVQGSQDPLIKELRKLELIDEFDKLEDRYKILLNDMKKVNDILSCVDDLYRNSVFYIHCQKLSTYEKEGRRLYMSALTLKRKVNKELDKYKEVDTRITLK